MAKPHKYRGGWRVTLHWTDPEGTTHRPHVYVPDPEHTRAGARKCEILAAEKLAELAAGRTPAARSDPGTLGDLLDRWIDARRPRLKPKSIDAYTDGIARVKPLIGDVRADTVTPGLLEDTYRDLERSGGKDGGPLSSSTVRHSHSAISAAYNWAIRREELARNPAEHAETPKSNKRIAPPAVEDVAAIFDLVEGTWQPALFRLAMVMGSRRGEFIGLRWSDIDLDEATVRRETTVTLSSEGIGISDETKTGATPPAVKIDADTVAAVRKLQELQKKRALAAGVSMVDDPWLFASPRHPSGGKVMSPEAVKSWWRRFRDEHPQFKAIQFRDCRDFVATEMLSAGVPLHVVAARLGHIDPATTLRRYTGWTPAADGEAVDMHAALLRAASEAQT